MVGQGVLRECLLDPEVERVLTVVRHATGHRNDKVEELVHDNFSDFSAVETRLSGYNACFFCLGVSAAGMSEEAYRRVTYEIALAVANTLVRRNAAMTFIFVSGAGADSSERGGAMWARVKGETENALLRLPFNAAYMFRPGIIRPLHGITSRTRWYRVFYGVVGPLFPLVQALFPGRVATTEQIGRAMLRAAKRGAPKAILEARDIIALAAEAPVAR